MGLLLMSVFIMGSFLFAAKSDGGAQVVDSYYDQAVQWDSISAAQQVLKKRDWIPYVTLDKASARLFIQDAEGRKIGYLGGKVTVSRPHRSVSYQNSVLHAVHSDSSYSFPFAPAETGLWDFTFDLFEGSTHIQFAVRKEVKLP